MAQQSATAEEGAESEKVTQWTTNGE